MKGGGIVCYDVLSGSVNKRGFDVLSERLASVCRFLGFRNVLLRALRFSVVKLPNLTTERRARRRRIPRSDVARPISPANGSYLNISFKSKKRPSVGRVGGVGRPAPNELMNSAMQSIGFVRCVEYNRFLMGLWAEVVV
jgi:hypothetical protein